MSQRVDQLIGTHREQLSRLFTRHRVTKAWVFGSATTDDFSDDSDIDLLIRFDEVPFDGYAENFWSLESELKKVFQREVDLVPEHTLKNPFFIYRVNEGRELIHG